MARALPLALLGAFLVAGCGGEGGHAAAPAVTGSLRVRFTWPVAAGRVIPTSAQSIRVQLSQNSTVTHDAVLTPANPTTSFTEVPTGPVVVKAVAYPTSAGTGNPMAVGQVSQTVTAGSSGTVDLTMASTIDHLTISPSTVSIAVLAPQQLTVTAYDASNAVVLTDPSDITWTADGLIVSVDSTGLVTGLSVGVGSTTATERFSGKSATVPITVHV